MSAQYRFDTAKEKLDEVKLVQDMDNASMKNEPAEIAESKSTISKLTTLFVVIVLLIILLLHVLLIAMMGYHMYRTSDKEECCGNCAAMADSQSVTQETCSTEITETHKTTQSIKQQMTQLLQVFGGTQDNSTTTFTEAIVQLLQEMHTDQTIFYENSTETMSMLLEHSEILLLKVVNIIGTLSTHKDTSIATAAVLNDILIVVEELLQLQNASSLFNSIAPVSCKDIKSALPSTPSGYYHVNSRDVYCNMEELCGSEGGWTRIAYLDMDDSTESCPSGLQLYQSGEVRACGRPSSGSGSCSPSVKFPTNGISYSEICGRLIGYQYSTPDAVTPAHGQAGAHDDIDSFYVDGISLTRGSPRQHVWTFMAGAFENHYSVYNCPCNVPPGTSQDVQSFVGSQYFCESGVPETYHQQKLYTADPLWDGDGCTTVEAECCSSVKGLPWFHRQYSNATTDYIEMRVCDDESTANEDNPVNFYEIYVK